MTLCSYKSLVNIGLNCARAVTLKCRSWGCPLCQPDRQRQLVAQAQAGKPTTFITLTSNPAVGSSPAARARDLAQAWPEVVRRACKKYRYKHIPYLCVFEATKRGEPHLHILARVKWIDQRWLSEQMKELTGAPVVDIRQVKNQKQVAHYISKYVGKEPHRFETCKRYWSTRSYALEVREKPQDTWEWKDGWHIVDRALWQLEPAWRARGWDVVMEGGMLLAAWEPPPDTGWTYL